MNAEDAIAAYLVGALSVPVYRDIPAERPRTFVSLGRTGGALSGRVADSALFAAQAWAETTAGARELAYAVRDALPGVESVENVFGVAVTSLFDNPDPDSRLARYQIVFTVDYME